MSKISSTKGWLFQLTASQGNWHRLHWYPLQHKSHFNSRPRERPTCTVLMPLETASYFNSRPRERPTRYFLYSSQLRIFQLTTSWEADFSAAQLYSKSKNFNSRPRERPTGHTHHFLLFHFHFNSRPRERTTKRLQNTVTTLVFQLTTS